MLDLLSDLNEPQRQAVMHVDGPLLVLAGAGSGKTRVITRRVAYIISQGIAPWNVLAITFTNKAAGEMRQRVESLGTPRGAMVCTFHSLCARLLREFAREANLEQNYTIYDRNDQIRIVKEAIQRLKIEKGRFSPQAVHAAISNAKNELKTADGYAQTAGDFSSRNIAEIYREYEKLLTANNALDFDDLLLRMAFLLRDRPDIREQLVARYRYVLIDEYQDTNRAQYILAHGIAGEHENICATGDPDQSIYAWRGADINNILKFEADYPNATVIRLEENYRSTKAILAAASQLISHNIQRKDKALWTSKPGGRNVSVVTCDNERAEVQAIARAILRHRADGGKFSDVAVFYRVNALSRGIEETLMNSGIAYRVARGIEFYNRKEIKDVLAYLKLMNNPADDLSCERIINVPARGIGATTVKRLKDLAASTGMSLLEACRDGQRASLRNSAANKTAAFAKMIDSMSSEESLDRNVRIVMEEVIKRSGLEAMLGGRGEEENQSRANVDELITSASKFDEATDDEGRLGEYLHQVSLVSDVDHMKGSGGAVTLMTLHAAKGLEFPLVFIVGCEEGMLPFQRMSDSPWNEIDPDAMEEERRLAFVGMTRAKEVLTLTGARERTLRGKTTSQAASRFLSEIDGEFVTAEDMTTSLPRSRRSRRNRFGGGFYDDSDIREEIEALESDNFTVCDDTPPVPPEYEHLRKGSRVHHNKFGYGQVTRIHTQPWPDTRVEVFFDDFGPKKLVLAMAKLEIV